MTYSTCVGLLTFNESDDVIYKDDFVLNKFDKIVVSVKSVFRKWREFYGYGIIEEFQETGSVENQKSGKYSSTLQTQTKEARKESIFLPVFWRTVYMWKMDTSEI